MMIETRALCKNFDGFLALDEAEVHVEKGSIYGLVGPNGCGKTTLMRHLAGLMRPTSGLVLVNGEPVFENTAVKARMLHVPDDLYFFPAMTVRDMAKFYKDVYPGFDMQRFEVLRAAFPLPEKRPVRRFSKGMQKQAAIWLGLCWQPELILLDEPMDGLDPAMRRTVWSLLCQDVAERGSTVFVSSHNLRELEDVCDHVGIMQAGRLVLERSLSQLQENIVKLQVAFAGEAPAALDEFSILHKSQSGRVHELIVRGSSEEVLAKAQSMQPLLAEAVPLSLEEVFIYELGGMAYAETLVQ